MLKITFFKYYLSNDTSNSQPGGSPQGENYTLFSGGGEI